jgi:hypothetical protein
MDAQDSLFDLSTVLSQTQATPNQSDAVGAFCFWPVYSAANARDTIAHRRALCLAFHRKSRAAQPVQTY